MKRSKEVRNMTLALVLYSRLNLSSGRHSSLDVYRIIDGACGKNRELALDLWATRELITILKIRKDELTLRALNDIYFAPFSKNSQRRIKKSEMSDRILRFSSDNYLNERTVYRKLKKARELWFNIRYELDYI